MASQASFRLDFHHCLNCFPATSFSHTHILISVKIIPLLTLPILLLSACAIPSLEEKKKNKEKKTVVTDAPPPPPELPTDGIDFSDPETAGSLLTDDKKKTVTGPAPIKKPIEGDNVINVAPPLPTPALPDE